MGGFSIPASEIVVDVVVSGNVGTAEVEGRVLAVLAKDICNTKLLYNFIKLGVRYLVGHTSKDVP